MFISQTREPVVAGLPDVFVAGLPDVFVAGKLDPKTASLAVGLLAAVHVRTILYPYVVGEFHRLLAQIFFTNF